MFIVDGIYVLVNLLAKDGSGKNLKRENSLERRC